MAPIVPPPAAGRRPGGGLTRIVVTGSESTGKTSLAEALASHYGVPWVPEFARDYALRIRQPLLADDVAPIAAGQAAREDEAMRHANGMLVLDTDLISTVVYAMHYYGAADPWIVKSARERLADLYLVCDIDLPWVADPVRDAQHHRSPIHRAFIRHLSAAGAVYRLVRGPDAAARLQSAIAHVEDWRRLART